MNEVVALGDKRLKVVLAGAGWISQFHLTGWKAMPDVELTAVCDPVLDKAKARAGAFGIPRVYTDFAEMLERERPDAVDIATPVGTHAQLTRLAADRGVHVMCQKPMTPTVAEGEALVRDVGGRVRFMVHENFRFRAHYRTAREWLRAGKVGEPRQVRLATRGTGLMSVDGATPGHLVRQPYLQRFPRLVIFEALIHQLDVLRFLFGHLEVVLARIATINPALTGEDAALIVLQGRAGLTVVLDGNLSAPGYPATTVERLEVMGTRATLLYEVDRLTLVGAPDPPMVFDLKQGYQDSFTVTIRHFVEGLRTGAPFETEAADNLEVLRLVEACYTAAGAQAG